jgi:periplasmic divalent cation tolerance protein
MSEEYCIVITTFADEKNGEEIIAALLDQRLAACVQVMPMQSCYRWQGKVNRDAEQLVLIKTRRALYPEVQKLILAHHAYEVPEIIHVPITDGFPGYLAWMRQECA